MKRFTQILSISLLMIVLVIAGCGKKESDTAKTEDKVTESSGQKAGTSTPSEALDKYSAVGLLPEERAMVAPPFIMEDISGKQHNLADYKGKVIILDFWDTWCPPCKKEIPGFIELYDKYENKGLTIIGAAFGRHGKEAVVDFAKEYNINYVTTLANPQIANAYGPISSIPTTYIIDREGRVRGMHIGYVKKETFEEQILALL